jgi:aconitate hydratase
VRDAGLHGVIVAGESYGQGSSREHAAICPMFLGVKAILARSIERIHAANLINFGILPLTFADSADYAGIEAGDTIKIIDVAGQLRAGCQVTVSVWRQECQVGQFQAKHVLSALDIDTVLAGGRLNVK